jgi:Xaa-Pro dipeptidase
MTQTFDEPRRLAELKAAEARAAALFAAIAAEGLVRPGVTEDGLSAEIFALAAERFGVKDHWHKRLVRAGPNTLATFYEETADRALAADDIAFVDLGPVFEGWEADYGATFVLGDDPAKLALRDDLEAVWLELRDFYLADDGLTGAELYAQAHRAAERRGWTFGGQIAGHLVGEFPHSVFPGGREASVIWPKNDVRMRDPDADGRARYWILEVHLVEPGGAFGGFCERLLA